jgi:hypothetical protein
MSSLGWDVPLAEADPEIYDIILKEVRAMHASDKRGPVPRGARWYPCGG